MATNIGRVEFIVDLDGDKIPAQARALGRQIAAAGKKSGKEFGDNFDSEFDKSLSTLGARTAAQMNKAGELGGEKFSKSFERSIRRNADKIQGSLGDMFADKKQLEKALDGFEDLEEGVKHYENELESLRKKTVRYKNDNGKMVSGLALTQDEFKRMAPMIREAANAVEEKRKVDVASREETERIRLAQIALNDEIDRLIRLSTDEVAVRKAANREGITYGEVTANMRKEMAGLNQEQQVSNRELTNFSDNLERTVEKLEKADAAVAKSADDKVKADRKRIDSERKVKKAQDDRLAAAKALDKAQADLDRKMGDVDVYREHVEAVGSVKKANIELKDSFEKLRDLGGTEKSIAGYERKLRSLTKEVEKSGKSFTQWGKDMSNPLEGAASAWRRMDGTVKLVVASILGAGDQVAVLGSALGAGLVALGGGIVSLVVGAAAGIGIVTNLFQDIEKAPAKMKPTIRSFQQLGKAFGDVGDEIAQAAFDEMGDAFTDIEKVVRKLEPGLEGVAKVIGKAVRGFADFTQSAEGFGILERTIKNAEKNLDVFIGTVGTLGGALLRAFDRAQPLVEDMFRWIDKLVTKFDAFTRSTEFTDWITNAQAVWGSFGGALDAVAEALHNLVTPEAVERTTDLLDNIARLAPGLGELLNVVGQLDPFGLLVDIFADLAEAFELVAPLAGFVATSLNHIIDAVPAPVWIAAATAIGLFVTAFAGIKVAAGIGGMFDTVSTSLAGMTKKMGLSTAASKKMGAALGKAGVFAAVAAAAVTAAFALDDLYKELTDLDKRATDAVTSGQSLKDAYNEFGKAVAGNVTPLTDVNGALDRLTGSGAKGMVGSIGNAFDSTGHQANALSQTLGALGPVLAKMNPEDAAKSFSAYAKELGATDAQAMNMINTMGPEFKASLEDAAKGADNVATEQEVLNYALGRTAPAAEGSADALAEMANGLEDGASGAELQARALERLTGKSVAALDAIEGVSDGIRSMGSAFREHESAASEYEAAIDGVTESISENGTEWKLSEEAGRANQAAIRDLAQSTLDLAAENYNLTGSATDAAAAISAGRDEVIKQLEAFGMGKEEANAYADQLGLIPGDVETVISANTAAGMEMADAFATRLYELGLIEVNPVLALDAVDAQAEADKIQSQLDGLTFTPYTTTLDANGKPIETAVAGAGSMLDQFSKSSYKTTLDADPAPASSKLSSTSSKMETFGDQTFKPTLDVNNVPGISKTNATEKKLDALEATTFKPKIDADATKVSNKITTTTKSLTTLDAAVYTPSLNVDNKQALSGTAAVKNSLDNIKSKTVTITVNTNYPNGRPPQTAMGGVFGFSQLRQIAEAGPEAVVPLRRPLAQVDPAVRALSAMAQGIPYAGGGGGTQSSGDGGSSSSTSRVVNIQPGAVVIQGDRAPETTATTVVNRLAQRIAG